jgi:tRNA G10  N-methylase Trm11
MRLQALKTEPILLRKHPLPEDYVCQCGYCKKYKGMLIREDGSYYNRNERRNYMIFKQGEGGAQHINPTPLHIARWAIQKFTKPGDWVLDPFIGSGTTAVEAINNERNAWGTEIDTAVLARQNVLENKHQGALGEAQIYDTDARKIWAYSTKMPRPQLVVLHPPYSGDEQSNAKYDPSVKGNLAFLKESDAYWNTMTDIFTSCISTLKVGGCVVIGVKEMMKNKKWWDLHIKFNNIIVDFDNMSYKGMVLLPHYPRTLHLNTYYKRWGVHPSYYQTITVWRKESDESI